MNDSLFSVGSFGTGTFLSFFLALIFPLLFVFIQCERRKLFPLRFFIPIILMGVWTYFQPIVTFMNRWLVGFLFDFIVVLAIFAFSFKVHTASLIFYGTSAWCIQHIFSNTNALINIFAIKHNVSLEFFSPAISYLRQFIIFMLILLLFFIFFIRDFVYQPIFLKPGKRRLLLLSLGSVLIVYAISNLSLTHGGLFNKYALLYDSICCFLLLAMIFFTNKINNKEMQRIVLDELQKQNSRQQVMRKENFESIAIRYHDLSKQLALLELAENTNSKKELIQEIKGELDNFSNLVETGNKALDIVLTDKKMVCLKNDIKLFYKVDEHVLDFVNEVDVYTIFSNLFDNAIETLKTEKKENKVIKLNIYQRGNIVSIDCQNYTSKKITFVDNLPQTDKVDKNSHGYGTLSIKKTVKKYSGSAIYRIEKSIFHAYIILQSNNTVKISPKTLTDNLL